MQVSKGLIGNKSALLQAMVWGHAGDKSVSKTVTSYYIYAISPYRRMANKNEPYVNMKMMQTATSTFGPSKH